MGETATASQPQIAMCHKGKNLEFVSSLVLFEGKRELPSSVQIIIEKILQTHMTTYP